MLLSRLLFSFLFQHRFCGDFFEGLRFREVVFPNDDVREVYRLPWVSVLRKTCLAGFAKVLSVVDCFRGRLHQLLFGELSVSSLDLYGSIDFARDSF